MKLGCGGCLSTLLGLVLAGVLVGGTLFAAVRSMQTPVITRVSTTAEDGSRAQQKVFGILQASRRSEIVVLSEPELQALVAHIDARDLMLRDPVIRLPDRGTVEVAGHLPLGKLLAESPLSVAAEILPGAWLQRPVWLRITAEARMETAPRRQLRLDPTRVVVGRQPLPALSLRLLLDPATLRFLRLRLPETVQDVEVERGRVVIRTGARA